MSGLDKISPRPKGQETKLGEMTAAEAFALQHPLALLMYNHKRQKEGLTPISLDPIHSSDLRDKEGEGTNEKEKIKLLKKERELQHKAFYEWVDKNNPSQLSERFREYIKKHPDQKIDLNSPTDIGTLFEFMFAPETAQEQSDEAKHVIAQDLI